LSTRSRNRSSLVLSSVATAALWAGRLGLPMVRSRTAAAVARLAAGLVSPISSATRLGLLDNRQTSLYIMCVRTESVSSPQISKRVASLGARERVLSAAYDLFSRQGIRAVGIDTIIARAGVAKMSFYRHFPSRDELVLAFLQKREQLWTHEWLEAEVNRRAVTPRKRLLAIFDVFDEWFQREAFEG